MTGKITLSGALPGAETNGLAASSKEFIDQPLKLVPVLAMVCVDKIVTKTRTGETYPVVAWQHLEVVPERHQAAFAQMLGDALGDRTGAAFLPFEIGEEAPMKEEPFPEEDDDEPIEITRPRRAGTRKPRRAAAQLDGLDDDVVTAIDSRSDAERGL
jgi:hypothetical protein